MTSLQWETLFSKIVNTPDNLPIAKGNATVTGNLGSEIITANRIKLGRNNFRSLGGEGIQIDLSTDAAKILENNRLIYSCWDHLYIDSIHQLFIRPRKWETTGRLPQVDDIILLCSQIQDTRRKLLYGNLGRLWHLLTGLHLFLMLANL